ncbi:MAG TPA: hypothetical protein VF384_20330 [Planctomycetota bacterium]
MFCPRWGNDLLRSTFAVLPFAAILVVTFVSSCQSSQQPQIATHGPIAAPAADAKKATDLPGLHNVVVYAPHMISGGQPEGAEGLETLAAMGIKTIISVDGAKPDVEGARRLGMRYVHLPISYDTVTPERQAQLAQAVSSCEGPIYMRCHHGKHRSAARSPQRSSGAAS